jgi:hypothetical protein
MQFFRILNRWSATSVFVIVSFVRVLVEIDQLGNVGSVVTLSHVGVDKQQILCVLYRLPSKYHLISFCKRTTLFLDPFSVVQNTMNEHLQKGLM